MKILAPAKINLSLDIVGRRPDGYHTLNMVMQSISLCDVVSAERTREESVELSCSEKDVPCDSGNTVLRAADAFFAAAEVPVRHGGLRFRVEKRIPRQAGLGGGSADAAAALKLLNRMYRAGLTAEQIRKIGLSIGADVPFCVEGGTASVQGIGEIVKPVAPMMMCNIVVCRPHIGISTKDAYAEFDQKGVLPSEGHSAEVLYALETGRLDQLGKSLGNAFEAVGAPKEISDIEEEMFRYGSLGACMTGSGSAVFGLFDRAEEAVACRAHLLEQYSAVFLCHPVSRIRRSESVPED